jgi:hypothetical protein
MPGITDSGTVDLITTRPDAGETALIIVAAEPWTGSDAELAALQAKLNAYLTYVLDGQLAQDYPQSQGHSVRIQIDCSHQPASSTLAFLQATRRQLADEYGIEVRVVRVG